MEFSNIRQILQPFNPYESNWQSRSRRNRILEDSRQHWSTYPPFPNAYYDHTFSMWRNIHENGNRSQNNQEHLESNEHDQVPDLELPPPSYSDIEDINALPPPSYEVAFQNEVDQIKHMTVISKKLRSHLWRSTLV